MKQLIIILAIIAIATPALARKTCKPYIKEYWRSSNGAGTIKVGFKCSGKGGGHNFNVADVCGITSNGKRMCASGFKNITVEGGAMKLNFQPTEYPIERLYIK